MSKPSITELEKHFVERAMEKSDIGVGEYIPMFDELWAQKNHKKYGVSCNSGTNAIYLALKALGIGQGDEVIVPEYTMIATAWAVSYTGAKPVFVDCGDDLLMNPSLISEKITEKTKAIIVVPIYGRTYEEKHWSQGDVYNGARKNGLFVIEDMAEAHGIQPLGDISCYSFYGNKILTTGEGGMCLTDNKEWADEMRKLANMYFDEGRTMIHPKMGHNFRMTNLQAAVGVAQVLRMEEILEKRKNIEDVYDRNLPEHVKMPRRDVLWMYDIQTDHQEELKAYLEKNGIPSRYGFKPMSMQPDYAFDGYTITPEDAIEEIKKEDKDFPNGLFGKLIMKTLKNKKSREYEHLNAYKWSKRILYLPTYTDLTESDVKHICKIVKSFESDK